MHTIDLPAVSSPEATVALNRMLAELQQALRELLRFPSAAQRDTPVLRAHLRAAFTAYDAFLAVVENAHPVSCRHGCTACCHDNPRGVTGIELRLLREEVARWPDAAAVFQRFADLAAQKTGKEQWRARKEPCPLLQDGACRAYSLRPIACRAFVSFTPASWCDPVDPHFPERLNPHLDPPKVILQLLGAISELLAEPVSQDLHSGMCR